MVEVVVGRCSPWDKYPRVAGRRTEAADPGCRQLIDEARERTLNLSRKKDIGCGNGHRGRLGRERQQTRAAY